MTDEPLVLGIETSCDETGVGIVRGHTLLADTVASSVEEHARFGGVVPEVASRAHLEAMVPTIERAAETAGISLDDVDAIAVTSGPGLAGALLVGVASAKALALGLGKPIYGVNHLAAHVAVDQLEHGPLPEPCLAMLVSGGHSSLLEVTDVTVGVEPMGSTIDDPAGEAFDKVARQIGLPFPGRPHIDRVARSGNAAAALMVGGAMAVKAVRDRGERQRAESIGGGGSLGLSDAIMREKAFVVSGAVREANDRGFECLVLGDCCGATDRGNHDAALKMVTMQGGVFGAVSDSATFLDQLP